MKILLLVAAAVGLGVIMAGKGGAGRHPVPADQKDVGVVVDSGADLVGPGGILAQQPLQPVRPARLRRPDVQVTGLAHWHVPRRALPPSSPAGADTSPPDPTR